MKKGFDPGATFLYRIRKNLCMKATKPEPSPEPETASTAMEPTLKELERLGGELQQQLGSMQIGSFPLGLTLSRDDAFLGAIGSIAKNPKVSEFLAYEGALLLVLWAFRAWRLSKVNTLFRQMLTQAWISVVYWVVALFLIPSFIWGEHFRVALSHLFRAVLRHFLS
jgi:hypothetical protein